ncbi:hypothetical protein GCK32_011010 [Trichostrongylus colubriformis]|uniref:Uncharacterized protein n=1 Tax=Trichostrongylus colubriformis TaxID=6319 RepID=A0AAN8F867_TRICO
MKIIWKSCVDKVKLAVHATFEKLSHGVKFQEVATAYNAVLDRFCPAKIHRPVQFILTYMMLHVYLLYATIYGITQFVVHHTRIRGSHIIPLLPSVAHCKEKIIMFVTSVFLWHWFSKSVLGISAGWEYISTWVVHLRPQINIKPQLKLVSVSDSCHSNASNVSMNVEEVNADMNVYLCPEKEEFADLMKNFQMATDTASFASDLVSSVAASITQSESIDSLQGWSSSGAADGEDEIDIDREMDKACLLERHANDFRDSEDSAGEQDQLLPETSNGKKCTEKSRLTLREVAKEVLHEVSSVSSGFRSRIPRPQALERFRGTDRAFMRVDPSVKW